MFFLKSTKILTLPYGDLIEPRRSKLKQLKFTFTTENVTCKLFWKIFSNFDTIRCWSKRRSLKLCENT